MGSIKLNRTIAIVFSLVFLIAFSGGAFGQIKIDEIGRVIVGPNGMGYFDPGRVLSMSVQGKRVSHNNAGSKLGFGDFGAFDTNGGGWNVFIGEYDDDDTDVLWLHGKRGIILTDLAGTHLVAEFGRDRSGRGVFMQDIRTDRIVVSSDENTRSSVSPVSGALQSLLQLSAVSYHNVFSHDHCLLSVTTESGVVTDTYFAERNNSNGTNGVIRTEKYIADSIRHSVSDSIRAAGTDRYGFILSELQQVFPDLVMTDDKGDKYIDYMSMIPIIVAALEEQQQTIEYLTAQLNVCCAHDDGQDCDMSNENGNKRSKEIKSATEDAKAELFQNSPNPFNRVTEIGYYLPRDTQSALIYIFNLNGTLIKSMPIVTMGDGVVSVNASELAAGMYVYSLVADGTIVDSKRMILTE